MSITILTFFENNYDINVTPSLALQEDLTADYADDYSMTKSECRMSKETTTEYTDGTVERLTKFE